MQAGRDLRILAPVLQIQQGVDAAGLRLGDQPVFRRDPLRQLGQVVAYLLELAVVPGLGYS